MIIDSTSQGILIAKGGVISWGVTPASTTVPSLVIDVSVVSTKANGLNTDSTRKFHFTPLPATNDTYEFEETELS